MSHKAWWSGLLVSIPLVCLLTGCGPSEAELADAARSEGWTELQSLQSELKESRSKLAELRQKVASGEAALEVAEGSTPEQALAQLQAEAQALEADITAKADAFMPQLVNYINEDPMVEGEPPSEGQLAALRLKTAEDIELAREYYQKGGDYRRALDILERTAQLDPENQALQAELAYVRDYRFTTQERFDQIEKGISQEQVREIMGQVFHRNVREYPEQSALAWFYPKDPDLHGPGAAAAIFFRKRDGQWSVYQNDWDAVAAQGE